MIVKVGIDVVEVSRIARAMKRPGFRERILTPEERVLCTTASRLAGRWAAKEAIAKAVDLRLGWHQVEILNDDSRAPYAVIHSHYFDPKRYKLHLSITHERSFAAAVAVLEMVGGRR